MQKESAKVRKDFKENFKNKQTKTSQSLKHFQSFVLRFKEKLFISS